MKYLRNLSGLRWEYALYQINKFIQIARQSGWRSAITRAYHFINTRTNKPAGLNLNQRGCSYKQWMAANEPGDTRLAEQREQALLHAYRPTISILISACGPEAGLVLDTIDSLLKQTYPDWELCLGLQGPGPADVQKQIDSLSASDQRVKVFSFNISQGQAAYANSLIENSSGDFVALMGCGDLMAPDMLYELITLLNTGRELDIVYCDEDIVSRNGKQRHSPWFKPTVLSPATLLSKNYLEHCFLRRSYLLELDGYDSSLEGAHEWDLAFRAIEKSPHTAHIPKVLYHKRAGDDPQPHTHKAQEQCISAHLERTDPEMRPTHAVHLSNDVIRVHLPVSDEKVSIIIPTKDKRQLLSSCLQSIFEMTLYPSYEIILVDTGSLEPDTLAYYTELEEEPRVQIVQYKGTFNYSAANNLGASVADGKYLLFLNNDTQALTGDWLSELVSWAARPQVAAVGTKLIRPDKTIQHAGIIMGLLGHGSHIFDGCQEDTDSCYGSSEWYRNYMAVTGACVMIPLDVFESMNGFSTLYQWGYSDIEFCLRAVEAGYQIIYTPFATLLHHEGATRGLEQPLSDILRATLQMYPVIHSGDPFYNPNISYLSRRPLPACEPDTIREKHLEHILRHFELVATQGTESTFFEHFRERFAPSAWPLLPIDTPPTATPPQVGQRLLFISHDFSRSGAPLVLQQLAIYLRDQGYRLRVLSPVEGPLYQQYLDSGIDTQIAPDLLEDARIVAEHAMEHDLVLANTILSWRAVHAASAMGKPCLWWLHEGEAGQSLARFSIRVQSTFPVAQKVIFPSQNTAELYTRFTPGDNFVTAYIGVQISDTVNNISPVEVDSSKFRILSTGSLEPRKGQDILLKALLAIPDSTRENLECYLIGRILDPQFHSRLERIIRRKNLHQVHMVGEITPEEVWSYLQTTDVFVLPSRNEVLPSSVLEAMAMGKAVVASKVGGVPEILNDGKTGILIPPEDPLALADILVSLYQNQDLVKNLGKRAKEVVREHYTRASFNLQMKDLIKETLNEHALSARV